MSTTDHTTDTTHHDAAHARAHPRRRPMGVGYFVVLIMLLAAIALYLWFAIPTGLGIVGGT